MSFSLCVSVSVSLFQDDEFNFSTLHIFHFIFVQFVTVSTRKMCQQFIVTSNTLYVCMRALPNRTVTIQPYRHTEKGFCSLKRGVLCLINGVKRKIRNCFKSSKKTKLMLKFLDIRIKETSGQLFGSQQFLFLFCF